MLTGYTVIGTMEEDSESEVQELHITSSSDEDEKQATPSPKRGNVTSKVSRHVLSEAKRTSMSIIILEEHKIDGEEEKKGKTIYFGKRSASKKSGLSQFALEKKISSVRIEPKAKKQIVASLRTMVDQVKTKRSKEEGGEEQTPSSPLMPLGSTFKLPQCSNDLKKGQNYGCKLFQLHLLPILPKLKTPWFIANVLTLLALMILSFVNIHEKPSDGFAALSIISSILAFFFIVIDGYLLYGSKLKTCDKNMEANASFQCRCQYSDYYGRWYEFLRLLCAEILMYPLLVTCIFELFTSSTPTELNVFTIGLLVVLSTYMLSIHILRSVMVLVALLKLRGLALISGDRNGINLYTIFFLRLFFHVIEESVVVSLILLSVGLCMSHDNVSANLWIIVFCGWTASILSIILFFIINYYWFQQLLLQIFIDMMECCQIPDISSEVFKDDKISLEEFLKTVSYPTIKQDVIRRRTGGTLKAKIYYPLCNPPFVVFAILFDLFLLVTLFCVFLELVSKAHLIGSNLMLILTGAFIVFANIHFILLFNVWLVVIAIIGVPLLIATIVKALDKKISKKGYVPIK
ncbi:PREDICTED: uncharacterized protein LOC109583248 [Amphimedon queenslandica]|uniref:Uncharacterized protein n=1 Tax=Amphimedon queenslandica TaxID=400682 RepID=A0A1X7UHS9_AMPQE|nr:PREDICTED: uncharacterized protein LOC109583248 [Amphimedon queenslandica]|eukprot:XP_019854053.1 PREDICTED: uncharacterized protein LOC109583248 [Amphimedon queenslandica]